MPRKASAAKAPKPVEALKHKDKRVNIPTEELREFVKAEEEAPKTMLYPRDPSLDPQLVWKGKDEQDREDLAVPVVPIYIQEKIHPQALIEDLRTDSPLPAGEGQGEEQVSLFDDFNGIKDFRQKIDFYSHDLGTQPKWSNRMILGDSLLVMTSLAEKEGLKGKVQMIYMDPPYGIKFGSNWQVSTRKRDVRDGKETDLTRQPEQVRAFRDTWEQGLHSYLSYLRDRLAVARDLLAESGSVFVQIGDENVHLARSVLDETFGAANFLGLITVLKTPGAGSFSGGTNVLAAVADYLLWYAKDAQVTKYRALYRPKGFGADGAGQYTWLELANGTRRPATVQELNDPPKGARFFSQNPLTSQTTREAQTTVFPVQFEEQTFTPSTGGWKTNRQGMARLGQANRFIAIGKNLRYVRYLEDFPAYPYNNVWTDTVTSGFSDRKVFVVQTNAKIIERCLLMTTDPGDLVLDPTCGSGTTAYVAEQWGRRWITIDTSRVALALARTRLMSAKYAYYILADSLEGRQREAKTTGTTAALVSSARVEGDIKKGFVYEHVPHVTLKSIAQNPDIHEGMSHEQIAAVNRTARRDGGSL